MTRPGPVTATVPAALAARRVAASSAGYWAPRAERCRGWAAAGRDVYVYFDNDAKGFAPHDALALEDRLD